MPRSFAEVLASLVFFSCWLSSGRRTCTHAHTLVMLQYRNASDYRLIKPILKYSGFDRRYRISFLIIYILNLVFIQEFSRQVHCIKKIQNNVCTLSRIKSKYKLLRPRVPPPMSTNKQDRTHRIINDIPGNYPARNMSYRKMLTFPSSLAIICKNY